MKIGWRHAEPGTHPPTSSSKLRQRNGDNTMSTSVTGLELAKIVEDFLTQLAENHFIHPCDCCGFPVPTPFLDKETEDLLCRNCRLNHVNGEHH